MLPDEARAAAAAEGLELVPSSSNETGFKGVQKHACGKYVASICENGKQHYLGRFATPEEAALCYARHAGAKRAAAEAAQSEVAVLQPLTADEARAAAAAEGLVMVRAVAEAAEAAEAKAAPKADVAAPRLSGRQVRAPARLDPAEEEERSRQRASGSAVGQRRADEYTVQRIIEEQVSPRPRTVIA